MKKIYFTVFLFFFILMAAFAQSSQDIDGFKLYPNPTLDGKIFIESNHNQPKDIQIFDVLGTQVFRTRLVGKELDLSNLNKGVYIVRIFANNKTATRKLVIK